MSTIIYHMMEYIDTYNDNGMETSTSRSGIGKTPLSRSLAMAVSEYVIDRDETEGSFPSYRCGNHLDFFRGTLGFVAQPCIYDDGDTPSDKPSWLKIFLDPSEDEASFWARWGACRFEKHQARLACSNVYDNAEEPVDDIQPGDMDPTVFLKMIKPLFNPIATAEDVNAILKRTFVVLFGKKMIYYRCPSADPDAKVQKFSYWPEGHDKDLLSESGINKLNAYRAGDKEPPASDHHDREWQLIFMKKVLRGEPLVLNFYTQVIYDERDVMVGRKYIEDKPDLLMDSRKRSHAQMLEDQRPAAPVGYIPGEPSSSNIAAARDESSKRQNSTENIDNLEDELEEFMMAAPDWNEFLVNLREEDNIH